MLTRAGERASSPLARWTRGAGTTTRRPLWPRETLAQAVLLERAGGLAQRANQPAEARTLLERARAGYEELGDPVAAARVDALLAEIDFNEGHPPQAVSLGWRPLSRCAGGGPPPTRTWPRSPPNSGALPDLQRRLRGARRRTSSVRCRWPRRSICRRLGRRRSTASPAMTGRAYTALERLRILARVRWRLRSSMTYTPPRCAPTTTFTRNALGGRRTSGREQLVTGDSCARACSPHRRPHLGGQLSRRLDRHAEARPGPRGSTQDLHRAASGREELAANRVRAGTRIIPPSRSMSHRGSLERAREPCRVHAARSGSPRTPDFAAGYAMTSKASLPGELRAAPEGRPCGGASVGSRATNIETGGAPQLDPLLMALDCCSHHPRRGTKIGEPAAVRYDELPRGELTPLANEPQQARFRARLPEHDAERRTRNRRASLQ